MTDRTLQHRRLHNLLLFRKLLSSNDASSPFTLVLDSVEQSARALVRHFIHGAKVRRFVFLVLMSMMLCTLGGAFFAERLH